MAYGNKRILTSSEDLDVSGEGIAGYVGILNGDMDFNFIYEQKTNGMNYVAFPLAGCETPLLPEDSPMTYGEIAVSKTSPNAGTIARFAQWVLTGTDNYNLVNYGVQDVDYRIEGARLAYLDNGKDISLGELSFENAYKVFFRIRPTLFSCDTMDPVTVYAPCNYEDVSGRAGRARPLWDIVKLRKDPVDCLQFFGDIRDEFQDIINARRGLLSFENIFNTDSKGSADRIAALAAMAPDTQRLTDAYMERIRRLREEQGE